MMGSLGIDPSPPRLDWETGCARLLETGLVDGSFYAAVIDAPSEPSRLAACGVAIVAQRLPGPRTPAGRWGYVQSMVTDDAYRRRGLARAIFANLMDWFDEQGVVSVELHASHMGESLYRDFGFHEGDEVALQWRAPRR